ncbi:MAG: aminodeoxychorismate lyase [Alphaproteobacteria bacterium]|nr:aminodeoxychorismate lyase [Alphaproteobacteria bacterium]|tara:strand:- start:1413 stop:2408 length:996 start_codon:yes stop_codon:yes gene_type:complete
MKILLRRKIFFILFFGFVSTSLFCLLAAYLYIINEFKQPGPLEQPKTFVITPGIGTEEIAENLSSSGVISNADIFTYGVWINGVSGQLKAGEYKFDKGISAHDVMLKIEGGDVVRRNITFTEGITSDAVIKQIILNKALVGDVFEVPEEGSLLPETYSFQFGDSRQSIIDRMKIAMNNTLKELWKDRKENLPYKKPADAVIMASIIEMETGRENERPIISAVFLNRLRLNMLLQSDPTVIYSITGGKVKLGRKLTKNDLATESPFNTYRTKGLPPLPISNPGRQSIFAALNPAITDALYFVADGKGGHRFARTLQEHNKNVKIWRQLEKNN